MRLRLEPGPVLADLRCSGPRRGAWRPNVEFVGSGKAALAAIFGFLRREGTLASKMSLVRVPMWLGVPVYHQIARFAFPTIVDSTEAKAVLVYHQYGFPQDMDRVLEIARERRLVVVEDCAHAAGGEYKGRALGTFGRFSLFSFSKFSFCYALGGVRAEDAGFGAYLAEQRERISTLLGAWINGFKLLDAANQDRGRPAATGLMDKLRWASYSLYGDSLRASPRAVALWLRNGDRELSARTANYERFRKATDDLGVCAHLEERGVAPYAIPVAVKPERAADLCARLRAADVEADVCRFDFNRNLFEPDFRPCVIVPCHGRLMPEHMDLIAGIVRGAA